MILCTLHFSAQVELEVAINTTSPNYCRSKGEQIALNVDGTAVEESSTYSTSVPKITRGKKLWLIIICICNQLYVSDFNCACMCVCVLLFKEKWWISKPSHPFRQLWIRLAMLLRFSVKVIYSACICACCDWRYVSLTMFTKCTWQESFIWRRYRAFFKWGPAFRIWIKPTINREREKPPTKVSEGFTFSFSARSLWWLQGWCSRDTGCFVRYIYCLRYSKPWLVPGVGTVHRHGDRSGQYKGKSRIKHTNRAV